jgi:SAM-dependent methyltransferase
MGARHFHVCKAPGLRATSSRVNVDGLHPGAVEHYQNATAYEKRYLARSEDVEFYLRSCHGRKSVLEYGAGAGRLTLPLARAGKDVCAVDTSAPMLSLLKARLRTEPASVRKRVEVKKADMRTFSTKRRFDRVIAGFHTVNHLYSLSDIASFLKRAFTHLKPEGRLEMDLPLPRIDLPGYDPIAQVQVTEMDGPGGPELLTLRWFGPQEIAMHLHHAGFRNIKLRSDFTRERISQETGVFTVSAQRPLERS